MPAGSFDSSWDALGPYLQGLSLDFNHLPAQLPASWAQTWPNVGLISLAHTDLASTLPKEWGLQGAFPACQQIWLYQNPSLTGDG